MFLAVVLHLCVHGSVVSHCIGEVCHVVVANGIQGLIFIVYGAIGYGQEWLSMGRIDGGKCLAQLWTPICLPIEYGMINWLWAGAAFEGSN